MDNSCNNIQLEIEMTNRERGDSIISNDIEVALDVPIERNRTLNNKEIKEINKCDMFDKCNEKCAKYQIIINTFGCGCVIICGLGLVLIIGVGFGELVNFILNY